MHSTQQIIENQKKYESEILNHFMSEVREAKIVLNKIDSEDEFILKEKEKLLKKFKKTNTINSIKKYFFMSNKRDEKFYIWWDEKTQEALILTYVKK